MGSKIFKFGHLMMIFDDDMWIFDGDVNDLMIAMMIFMLSNDTDEEHTCGLQHYTYGLCVYIGRFEFFRNSESR